MEEAEEASGFERFKVRGENWVRFFLAMGYEAASEARANTGDVGRRWARCPRNCTGNRLREQNGAFFFFSMLFSLSLDFLLYVCVCLLVMTISH